MSEQQKSSCALTEDAYWTSDYPNCPKRHHTDRLNQVREQHRVIIGDWCSWRFVKRLAGFGKEIYLHIKCEPIASRLVYCGNVIGTNRSYSITNNVIESIDFCTSRLSTADQGGMHVRLPMLITLFKNVRCYIWNTKSDILSGNTAKTR